MGIDNAAAIHNITHLIVWSLILGFESPVLWTQKDCNSTEPEPIAAELSVAVLGVAGGLQLWLRQDLIPKGAAKNQSGLAATGCGRGE